MSKIQICLHWSGEYDQWGWKRCYLDLLNDGKRVDRMSCYSGGAAAQKENFVRPERDWAGSYRPIHEGVFTIGKVYRGQFQAGIGQIWIPVEIMPKYRSNNRGAFGFHDDANRTYSRGSAGCIVFYKKADLEYVIRWLNAKAKPTELVVDWKTGFLAEKGFKWENEPETEKPSIQPTRISDQGIELVKHFEGCHRKLASGDITAYLDPVNIPTIGYGHTKGVKIGQTISQWQAEEFLRQDMNEFETGTRRLIEVPVNQSQFDALTSFSFNCGLGAFSMSTLRRKLNSGDYNGAADELLRWNKAGGRELAGLTRRRKSERHLFLTGSLKYFF